VAALAAAALTTPGCVFAVGSSSSPRLDDRVEKLERRIAEAERRLGVDPSAAPAAGAAR
jgi:hypothetical protein